VSDVVDLGPPPTLNTITAAELARMDLKPPKQLVEGVFTVGLNIFAGNPKAGKSFALLGISLAVANGGKAFNRIPVEKASVLYLALEDNHYRLKNRLKALNQPAPENLSFVTSIPRLAEGGLLGLHAYLDQHPDTGMVVIDTLARIADPKVSGNIYDEDSGMGSSLQSLGLEHDVAVVVVHHTRKAAAGDFLHSVSGSSGLTGAADTVAVLNRKRNETTATLEITGRDIYESSRELHWYSPKGGWIMHDEPNQPHGPNLRRDVYL
jgi:RecA-family ATPase